VPEFHPSISKQDLTKLYYSISEVSNMFGLSNSTLRYWETEFNTLKPKKNRHGDRAYTKKDIQDIEKIYFLVKQKGFTIEGAKNELKQKKPNSKMAAIDRLKQLRKQMVNLLDSLG
jgi:DNA-binding transcriptional MerR regulator